MRVLLISFLVFFSFSHLLAQQDKMFSQYMNYPSSINPAYVGSRGVLQILSVCRQQWVGFDGAPKSAVLSINSPLKVYGLGLGFSLDLDKIGLTKSRDVSSDISYKLRLNSNLNLNFGFKLSLSTLNMYFSDSKLSSFNNDALLLHNIDGDYSANVGVGIFLYSEKYFIGISSPKLLECDLGDFSYSSSKVKRNRRHYYFMFGYVFELNPFLKFKPTSLLKITQASTYSLDISAMFIIYDSFWLGSSYRNNDSLAAILQYNINPQFKVGYSYDFPLGDISRHSGGSHELSLSYDLDFKGKMLKSPRYF